MALSKPNISTIKQNKVIQLNANNDGSDFDFQDKGVLPIIKLRDHRYKPSTKMCNTMLDSIAVDRKKLNRMKRLSELIVRQFKADESGGLFVLEELGLAFYVPPNALLSETTLFLGISHYDEDLRKINGKNVINNMLSPVIVCGPHGTKFEKPATLFIKHSLFITDQSTHSSVCVYRSDTALDEDVNWQRMDSLSPQISQHWCWVNISEFSKYFLSKNEDGNGGNICLRVLCVVIFLEWQKTSNNAIFRVYVIDDANHEKSIVEDKEKQLPGNSILIAWKNFLFDEKKRDIRVYFNGMDQVQKIRFAELQQTWFTPANCLIRFDNQDPLRLDCSFKITQDDLSQLNEGHTSEILRLDVNKEITTINEMVAQRDRTLAFGSHHRTLFRGRMVEGAIQNEASMRLESEGQSENLAHEFVSRNLETDESGIESAVASLADVIYPTPNTVPGNIVSDLEIILGRYFELRLEFGQRFCGTARNNSSSILVRLFVLNTAHQIQKDQLKRFFESRQKSLASSEGQNLCEYLYGAYQAFLTKEEKRKIEDNFLDLSNCLLLSGDLIGAMVQNRIISIQESVQLVKTSDRQVQNIILLGILSEGTSEQLSAFRLLLGEQQQNAQLPPIDLASCQSWQEKVLFLLPAIRD